MARLYMNEIVPEDPKPVAPMYRGSLVTEGTVPELQLAVKKLLEDRFEQGSMVIETGFQFKHERSPLPANIVDYYIET
jgi:hypothetical protein